MRVLYKVRNIYLTTNKEETKATQNSNNFKESLRNRLIRSQAQKPCLRILEATKYSTKCTGCTDRVFSKNEESHKGIFIYQFRAI